MIEIRKTYIDTSGRLQTILAHAKDHTKVKPLFCSNSTHYDKNGKAIRGGHHLIIGEGSNKRAQELDEARQIQQKLIDFFSNNHVDKLPLVRKQLDNLYKRMFDLLE